MIYQIVNLQRSDGRVIDVGVWLVIEAAGRGLSKNESSTEKYVRMYILWRDLAKGGGTVGLELIRGMGMWTVQEKLLRSREICL